jgi:hypothetical protein
VGEQFPGEEFDSGYIFLKKKRRFAEIEGIFSVTSLSLLLSEDRV